MNITLDRFYAKLFTRYASTVAVQSPRTRLLYEDLGNESRALANGFREMQLDPGDRVGLLMRNRYEYIVAEMATIQAGGVVVPLIHRLDSEDIGHIVTDAGVDILVVGPSYFETAKQLQAAPDTELDFVVGVIDDGDGVPIGFQAYDEVIEKAATDPPAVDIAADDGAIAQYTSGTTGTQKGALHTHEGIVSNIYSHISELDLRRDERMLLTTPLGHSAGYLARSVLSQGGTVLLRDGFGAEEVLRTLEESEITATFAIPTMIAELLESPELAERTTASLRTLIYGAAPIQTTTLKQGLEELGEVFVQLYGLAEVPNLVTVLPKHEHDPAAEAGLDSAGYPVQLANVEIRTEETDWDDDVGEVVVESPYAMAGYLNEDDRGADAEWIRTGDLGRIDDAGRLVVLDRVDDVILRDGQPIYSTEVENVIQRHASVGQVSVIGVPRDQEAARATSRLRSDIEQVPKAVIVPASGNEVDIEELLAFCREELADHEVPTSVDTVAKLPETPYGKIDKRTLRKPYW
jgi:fatty-acyl-CoA synthase/long-chain acyl-CoA synthetase